MIVYRVSCYCFRALNEDTYTILYVVRNGVLRNWSRVLNSLPYNMNRETPHDPHQNSNQIKHTFLEELLSEDTHSEQNLSFITSNMIDHENFKYLFISLY